MANKTSFGRTSRVISRPQFVVDEKSILRDTGRQVDWDLVPENGFKHGEVTFEVAANAAVDAVSLTTEELPADIESGALLYFGPDKYVRVTNKASAGATSVDVEALVTALVDGDTATYGGYGSKFIYAGTEYDLLASGMVVPSSIGTAGVTCFCIGETMANEESRTDALTGYGMILSGILYDNLLPNASGDPKTIPSAHKTELLDRGGSWQFLQYTDNT